MRYVVFRIDEAKPMRVVGSIAAADLASAVAIADVLFGAALVVPWNEAYAHEQHEAERADAYADVLAYETQIRPDLYL